ncbi:MAG: HAD family hydrolase [Pseudomonadota bacterium]
MVGTDRRGCIDRLAAVIDDDAVRQRVMNACDAVHYERLSSNRLPLKAGALAALDWLDAACIPYALVTSSSRREVDLKLEAALLRRFQVVVSRNDVSRPKPDPQPYLLAAKLLGLTPAVCLAMEDSAPGATSAFRAGVPVAVIIDIHPPMLGPGVHPITTVRSFAEAWPALFGASLELPA